MLLDYISNLNIDIISKTILDNDRILLGTDIDVKDFYKEFSTSIDTDILTHEKALYIAAMIPRAKYISSKDLILDRLMSNY